MAKIMSMTANAEKDFIEKMEQHFEERWQEVIQSIIDLQNAIEKYHYITPDIAIGILSRINRMIADIDE